MNTVKNIATENVARLRRRFALLYGEEMAERCLIRLSMMIGRYGIGEGTRVPYRRWDQREAILITYGDMIGGGNGTSSLAALKRFADTRLADVVTGIHILPFFPYSSDDGFSVIHFRLVDPALGAWQDVQALGERFRLMFDLVLNHVSQASNWFSDYLTGVAPGRGYFIEVEPGTDLDNVIRPRTSPLLKEVVTRDGKRNVWTTFSDDQIDLNYANPDVLFEMLDILLFYVSMGATIVRLDAIAFLWKKIGTSCLHLPETHEVVKLFRDFLDMVAPDVLLLTETNVPEKDNLSYFGQGDEAHMVYQFPLPPLLLHALHSGSSQYLSAWAEKLPAPPPGCTYFNFTASHDGIGVRPLQGLVPETEIAELARHVAACGGRVSTAAIPGGGEAPYEFNVTYFDALRDAAGADDELHVQRFLCSQTIPMALRGVPAFYFNSLIAAPNYSDGVAKTGRARTINRQKWSEQELEDMLSDPASSASRALSEISRLLRLRGTIPAFHPGADQRVLRLSDKVFAIQRTSQTGEQRVLALSNVSSDNLVIPLPQSPMTDMISGSRLDVEVKLAPYQTVWLKV